MLHGKHAVEVMRHQYGQVALSRYAAALGGSRVEDQARDMAFRYLKERAGWRAFTIRKEDCSFHEVARLDIVSQDQQVREVRCRWSPVVRAVHLIDGPLAGEILPWTGAVNFTPIRVPYEDRRWLYARLDDFVPVSALRDTTYEYAGWDDEQNMWTYSVHI